MPPADREQGMTNNEVWISDVCGMHHLNQVFWVNKNSTSTFFIPCSIFIIP